MSQLRSRWLPLALLSAGLCGSLNAVDGVVLISQVQALAGNVTPGDAPGFPVTISLPGSYRLSGNLTVPDANTIAIQIAADNVTIDLNGFSIIGPVVCTFGPVPSCGGDGVGSGSGVVASVGDLYHNIKVANGTVRGMGYYGIFLGNGGHVENIHAESNGYGGIVAGYNGITGGGVIGNDASYNGSFGILARSTVVSGNTAIGNGQDGIEASDSTVSGNTALGNAGNGITASRSTVSGNAANRNKQSGLNVNCPSTVIGNTAVSNVGANLVTSGLPACTVANNTAP